MAHSRHRVYINRVIYYTILLCCYNPLMPGLLYLVLCLYNIMHYCFTLSSRRRQFCVKVTTELVMIWMDNFLWRINLVFNEGRPLQKRLYIATSLLENSHGYFNSAQLLFSLTDANYNSYYYNNSNQYKYGSCCGSSNNFQLSTRAVASSTSFTFGCTSK